LVVKESEVKMTVLKRSPTCQLVQGYYREKMLKIMTNWLKNTHER